MENKESKCSVSGVSILTILILILNGLMSFLFAVYFHIDKGNVLAVLFAEKIIILDIAIVCAIGKALDWSIFKYLAKLKGESHGKTKSINKNEN